VQHHAAHQLNIIMPLAQCAHRRLSCGGKRLWEQIVQVFALGDPSFELDGHSAQFVIAKPLKFRLQLIHFVDVRLHLLDDFLVRVAEHFCDAFEHFDVPLYGVCRGL
jgi:hypothetical protein